MIGYHSQSKKQAIESSTQTTIRKINRASLWHKCLMSRADPIPLAHKPSDSHSEKM